MPFSALELLYLAKEARKGFVFELGANFFTKNVPFKWSFGFAPVRGGLVPFLETEKLF